jgi:hypothetical protein
MWWLVKMNCKWCGWNCLWPNMPEETGESDEKPQSW